MHSKKTSFNVNTRIAYSMRACAQGYAGLDKFSSLMNFPMPITANNFDKIVKKLLRAAKPVAGVTMQDDVMTCMQPKMPKQLVLLIHCLL